MEGSDKRRLERTEDEKALKHAKKEKNRVLLAINNQIKHTTARLLLEGIGLQDAISEQAQKENTIEHTGNEQGDEAPSDRLIETHRLQKETRLLEGTTCRVGLRGHEIRVELEELRQLLVECQEEHGEHGGAIEETESDESDQANVLAKEEKQQAVLDIDRQVKITAAAILDQGLRLQGSIHQEVEKRYTEDDKGDEERLTDINRIKKETRLVQACILMAGLRGEEIRHEMVEMQKAIEKNLEEKQQGHPDGGDDEDDGALEEPDGEGCDQACTEEEEKEPEG